jgi:hypothetical protein
MRSSKVLACTMLALFFISNASALAESPQGTDSYVPSLGDMMAAIQLKHSKLWYAAKLRNWPLADYELGQLDASLKGVTRFYPDTPASQMSAMQKLVTLIGESIKAKDGTMFEQAFAQMTNGCNGCHEEADRAFIYVRRPALPSPYSDQAFAPRKR